MPTATLELVRSGAYDVVAFVPRGNAELPEGLYAFSQEGCFKHPTQVALRLAKDSSGTDITPVLVAADWLRDEAGWDVVLPAWVRRQAGETV